MNEAQKTPAHAQPGAAVLDALDADGQGLSEHEVERRRQQYGFNQLPSQRKRGPVARFLDQFRNTLVYVLIVAAAITATLGHWIDTSAIAGIVVINAGIGFVQEGRAERALAALKGLLSPSARVWRDGRRRVVDATELVPGDIVLLSAGDKVPADIRLLRARNLLIDEAVLTGESEPAEKQSDPVEADALLGDRFDMAFSGTLVRSGEGEGVVVAIGASTAIGAMSSMLAGVEKVATPLMRQIHSFSQRLAVAIIALAASIFGLAVLVRDYPLAEAFLASVGIAVAAIPQGLPAIMTITLAVGVQAMAQRRAVIRHMYAAETLGSVTTICSDKTGTLTRNEMTAVTLRTAAIEARVTGTGYAPRGRIECDGAALDLAAAPDVMALVRCGLLCNEAELEQDEDGEWQLQGDPTEGALLTLALKAGLEPGAEKQAAPRVDSIPFSSENRYMATLNRFDDGLRIVVKGAPEQVLTMCSHVLQGDSTEELDANAWHELAERIAAEGQRVIAVAQRWVSGDQSELAPEDVDGSLVLLGVLGLIDPPRQDAVDAVAECRSAGIRVKMITGDHARTACAIGAKMGIGDGERVLTGTDLDALDEAALSTRVADTDVFARVSPGHKLRLVQALQANGEVVAMTGDGVNDAPALKRADVGVAMGKKGTEVAKEAAEIVLTDDNFASIAAAVRLGRAAYDNIKRSVLFLLPTNGGEAMAIIAAVLIGMELPVTPVQILWVNMVTAATLGLALAFEPPRDEVMRRRPRAPGEPIVSAQLLLRIALVAVVMLVGTFGFYGFLRRADVPLDVARTAAVNALVLFEAAYLLSARLLERRLRHWRDFTGNPAVWKSIGLVLALQLVFTYTPGVQMLMGSAAMPVWYWAVLVPLALTVLPVVELEKRILEVSRGS
ncbi:P-type E1-E2 ATPase [Halospina denitrificans]|uniref:P-type E1-E2 ATPase n=1 Tax=Halospina denitrificans TaxID=332522 RepID=A0A4R7JT14_9GAMM|nr:HAD-IC family P-type ATPase [Halospina denitrificans]TDT41442.1 P-type E1-E2 ATPase [Halospina denitrificans]